LTTEDALPLWAAEELGLFDAAGLRSVEIVTFQAAQERDAAFAAGEIDAFMGDIIAAAQLEAGGSPVTIATVMLGATPAEGRFGIVAAPGTDYADLSALAGVPVGTSSGTIQEYVLDGLMRQAGVPADQVVKEEVKKVPVRFDLLMQGQLEAAALPEPLLTLAEAQGAKLLADDTTGENLSQTILGFSDEYLAEPGGIETMTKLLEVWDQAVAKVNEDPDAWRATLVEQARLPEPIKDTYAISTYPTNDVPDAEQIDAVLAWMGGRGLLQKPVTFEDLVLLTP
jgi:NitT/TauT family transport system substrate-binding protein